MPVLGSHSRPSWPCSPLFLVPSRPAPCHGSQVGRRLSGGIRFCLVRALQGRQCFHTRFIYVFIPMLEARLAQESSALTEEVLSPPFRLPGRSLSSLPPSCPSAHSSESPPWAGKVSSSGSRLWNAVYWLVLGSQM